MKRLALAAGLALPCSVAAAQCLTPQMSPIVTFDPDREGSRPSMARPLTAAELKLAFERADVIDDAVKATPVSREPGPRISLMRSWAVVGPQRFDLLAVDAFSSDSYPAHLITREAMEVYRRHLRDSGVVAVHVSNRYLSLVPVVAAAAAEAGLRAWFVEDLPADDTGRFESDWVLVTANDALLAQRGKGTAAVAQRNGRPVRAWTDDFNNLFEVLR